MTAPVAERRFDIAAATRYLRARGPQWGWLTLQKLDDLGRLGRGPRRTVTWGGFGGSALYCEADLAEWAATQEVSP